MKYVRSIVYHLTEDEARERQAQLIRAGHDCVVRQSAGDDWILIELVSEPVQHGQSAFITGDVI